MVTIYRFSGVWQYKNMLRFGLPIYNINSSIKKSEGLKSNKIQWRKMVILHQIPFSVVMQSDVLISFKGEELLGDDGLVGELFLGLCASRASSNSSSSSSLCFQYLNVWKQKMEIDYVRTEHYIQALENHSYNNSSLLPFI